MKHDNIPNPIEDTAHIQNAVSQQAVDQKLSCITAFEISEKLDVSPKIIGRTLDQLNFRITRCQLGLFGYSPEKKIVTPSKNIDPQLKAAIEKMAKDGRLSCLSAWDIASRLQLPKMDVSNACEGLSLKIKSCQLGAF